MKAKGLGKGLGAIFETEQHNVAGIEISTTSSHILLTLIDTNASQPRTIFDDSAIEELAASIKRLGVIQPITVRRIGERYQIISGERRYRAAQMAGLTSIASYVRNVGDTELLEMALVENVQREELGAMEIALTMRRLVDELGLTQQQLSQSVGERRSTIANYLRLLSLAPFVQKALGDGAITMGHAKVLASIDNNEQIKWCDKVIKGSLSVRALEDLIARSQVPKVKSIQKEDTFAKYGTRVGNILGVKHVKIDSNARGAGRMTIKFSSKQELEDIISKIDK